MQRPVRVFLSLFRKSVDLKILLGNFVFKVVLLPLENVDPLMILDQYGLDVGCQNSKIILRIIIPSKRRPFFPSFSIFSFVFVFFMFVRSFDLRFLNKHITIHSELISSTKFIPFDTKIKNEKITEDSIYLVRGRRRRRRRSRSRGWRGGRDICGM